MATLSKHVLGIPSGTIGDSVCFSTWRGKACIKSIASKHDDPNTDAQISARLKFKLLGRLTSALRTPIVAGFKTLGKYGSKAMTALNAFVKYNYDKDGTFKGQGPDEWEIDYSKLAIAQGDLLGFETVAAHMDGSQNCVFQWTSDEEADPDDEIYCVVYNEGLNRAKRTVVARSAGTASIAISDSWLEDAMHSYAYIFAFNGKKASASEFLLDIVDY